MSLRACLPRAEGPRCGAGRWGAWSQSRSPQRSDRRWFSGATVVTIASRPPRHDGGARPGGPRAHMRCAPLFNFEARCARLSSCLQALFPADRAPLNLPPLALLPSPLPVRHLQWAAQQTHRRAWMRARPPQQAALARAPLELQRLALERPRSRLLQRAPLRRLVERRAASLRSLRALRVWQCSLSRGARAPAGQRLRSSLPAASRPVRSRSPQAPTLQHAYPRAPTRRSTRRGCVQR